MDILRFLHTADLCNVTVIVIYFMRILCSNKQADVVEDGRERVEVVRSGLFSLLSVSARQGVRFCAA